MADNVEVDNGTLPDFLTSTEEITTLNGATVTAQHGQRVLIAIRTADATAIDLPGDAANGVDVDVTRLPALPAGTNDVGNVGVKPITAGGVDTASDLCDATDNATNVKSSAGQVYGWYITNTSASVRYVKLYNKATAPTSGDTPKLRLTIPGATTGGGSNVEFSMGIPFSLGIGYRVVTGAADPDTTAPVANEVILNIFFK